MPGRGCEGADRRGQECCPARWTRSVRADRIASVSRGVSTALWERPMSHSEGHLIALEPADRVWLAGAEVAAPLPAPTPAPFDREDCLNRLRRLSADTYGYLRWDRLRLPEVFSPQEAHFWLVAMAELRRERKRQPAEVAQQLEGMDLAALPTAEKAVRHIEQMDFG